MARKKVKLPYAMNALKKNSTFRKMKIEIIKELEKLKSLYGMEGCAIISTPNNPNPVVWPSVKEVEKVIYRLRVLEMEERNKMVEEEISLLEQRIMKLDEERKKMRDKKPKTKMASLFMQLENDENMSMEDLKTLDSGLDELKRELKEALHQMEAKKVI